MDVHVDRVISDVTLEPEPSPASQGTENHYTMEERLLNAAQRMAANRLRTAAEGYDD